MANETYNPNMAAKISALKLLAQRTDARLDVLESGTLTGIKVNGAVVAAVNRIVDILIASGTANGTIAVAGVDVAVKGLAALAYKANVSKDDLADALKAEIDAKAKQADLDTLTGTGDGSIQKMIDDAFNDFSTKVTDDNVVNSYKELIDWVAAHGSEATEMAAGISANKTAIENLKKFVGELPEGATSTTVIGYIAEAISALSVGDYAKAADLTALAEHVTTLEGKAHEHSNKDVLDGITAAKVSAWDGKAEKTEATTTAAGLMSAADKAKLDGIEFATDAEVEAMLNEVYGTVTA